MAMKFHLHFVGLRRLFRDQVAPKAGPSRPVSLPSHVSLLSIRIRSTLSFKILLCLEYVPSRLVVSFFLAPRSEVLYVGLFLELDSL